MSNRDVILAPFVRPQIRTGVLNPYTYFQDFSFFLSLFLPPPPQINCHFEEREDKIPNSVQCLRGRWKHILALETYAYWKHTYSGNTYCVLVGSVKELNLGVEVLATELVGQALSKVCKESYVILGG